MQDDLLVEYQDNRARQGFAQAACVRTLVTKRHRLSIYRGEAWGELYDHQEDPQETRNLWDSPAHHALQSGLTQQLLHKMLEAVDPSPRTRYNA